MSQPVTLGDTLRKVVTTLLSIAKLRQEQEGAMIDLATNVQIIGRLGSFKCSLLRAPCPPILYGAYNLLHWDIDRDLSKSDGRSLNTNCDWDRVIQATVLTYRDFADKLETVWNGDERCSGVLNKLIENYIVVSGWTSAKEFRKTSFATFKEYYKKISEQQTIEQEFVGYFSPFSTSSAKKKFDEDYFEDQKLEIIFGPPMYKGKVSGDASFVFPMRRALLFFYFLLTCPAGALIQQHAVAPGTDKLVTDKVQDTSQHTRFKEIYKDKKSLSSAKLIAELAAQACENFLLDGKRLEVVKYANGQLEKEEEGGEAKQRPGTTGTPGPSSELAGAFHRSLASFPAGCDLSQAAITSCQASCALSLFAATPSTGGQVDRHYAADFLFKILKPGPAYELCVYSACTQAALFASTQASAAPSDMFKVMYTPLDVTTQVKRMHSSCAGTDTWNGRHPLTRLQVGADAYSALCRAHPTIAASASYAAFKKEHSEVERAWLTTKELFASYRVGLLVCYALPALGERRDLLQTAVSTAACLVAPKNAGAAVHAVFNHCQYWLPLENWGSLVAAAELPNDRHLLLLSDHHDKFSVQNVSTADYNSRTGGWAQWYRQRLLFDLSCWVEGVDSASIKADTRLIASAIDTDQVAALSGLGRTAFARWSLGQA